MFQACINVENEACLCVYCCVASSNNILSSNTAKSMNSPQSTCSCSWAGTGTGSCRVTYCWEKDWGCKLCCVGKVCRIGKTCWVGRDSGDTCWSGRVCCWPWMAELAALFSQYWFMQCLLLWTSACCTIPSTTSSAHPAVSAHSTSSANLTTSVPANYTCSIQANSTNIAIPAPVNLASSTHPAAPASNPASSTSLATPAPTNSASSTYSAAPGRWLNRCCSGRWLNWCCSRWQCWWNGRRILHRSRQRSGSCHWWCRCS